MCAREWTFTSAYLDPFANETKNFGCILYVRERQEKLVQKSILDKLNFYTVLNIKIIAFLCFEYNYVLLSWLTRGKKENIPGSTYT